MSGNIDLKLGYDQFDNNTFNHHKWGVPSLVTAKEVKECIEFFGLVGRKIKRMKIVGLCYNLGRDEIENYAYNCLNTLCEEERQTRSDYLNIDDNLEHPRCAEVDEPLLIEFEDGDQLEIEGIQDDVYCMSMNRIPWNIEAGINPRNMDANVLFSPCLNAKIRSVEVIPTNDSFLSARNIILWLEDDNGNEFCGISIQAIFDYCYINIISSQDKHNLMISMGELKKGLLVSMDEDAD